MIQMLMEHWTDVTMLAAFIATIATAWVKVKDKIDTLAELVQTNLESMDKRFDAMKNSCEKRLAMCGAERVGLSEEVTGHLTDTVSHMTPNEREMHAEWRSIVLKRFDRIEALIMGRTYANKSE